MNWPSFLKTYLVTFGSTVAGLFAFIVVLNPYGNLPVRLLGPHVIMDSNQRFQYPAVARSGDFDSAVFGTSTSRLLDPADLDQAFGGRFVNLGLNDGRAWEQVQLARLFLEHVERPRTILVGLDTVWCSSDAGMQRTTRLGFPEWMFDSNPWNDWLYVLNDKAVEIAGRKMGYHLGLSEPRIPADGFDVFTPPENTYDAARARLHIWNGNPPPASPETASYVPTDAERASLSLPALDWLADLLDDIPRDTRVILAFMPVHNAAIARRGSYGEFVEAQCKAKVAAIAARRSAHVVDFRIPSSITTEDSNYWDPLHYRLHVGRWIVGEIRKAVDSGRGDPSGQWAYLSAR